MTTLQSVQALLKANFDLAPETLQPEAKLADLAIDSLAVLEVLFAVEDAFKDPQHPFRVAVICAKHSRCRLRCKTDFINYLFHHTAGLETEGHLL